MTAADNRYLLGVDTGGTFTDFVLLAKGQIRIHKCLSTPAAPEQAILTGIRELQLQQLAAEGRLVIVHGSTVATNAALEAKGVRTVYIGNRGFKDLLSIGRQARRELFNLTPQAIAPPVPSELCLETGGRLSAQGEWLEPLSQDDIAALKQAIATLKPRAVAINLLFSFLDDSAEQAIEAAMPEEIFCSRSSFVLPEYGEYERGMATWLNAWLGPLVADYLTRLESALQPSPVAVMQSSGGTIAADQAAKRAVNMLLSGPAGGLAAAKFVADLTNSERLLTFDMGGTSTDVALIAGDIQLTNEGHIGHYPVAVPMVDMHTIGAGGGSIASVDAGGLLQVGPQSAGAYPGPACYGQGGKRPTVTDANALLGRLRPAAFLGGRMQLDIQAARAAMSPLAESLKLSLEEAAEGVLALANEHMTRALRVISVQRGHNPQDFQLCCFGGAGGLHLCALADNLNMRQALVPVHGGVFSALGMLAAPRERQLSRTYPSLLAQLSQQAVEDILQSLAEQGINELLREGVEREQIKRQPSLDLRYQGQSYTLNLPWQGLPQLDGAFHHQHLQRYGHDLDLPIEVVNIRLALRAQTVNLQLPPISTNSPEPQATEMAALYGYQQAVPVYQRSDLPSGYKLTGPALITEEVSTTLLDQGWGLEVDAVGNLLLKKI